MSSENATREVFFTISVNGSLGSVQGKFAVDDQENPLTEAQKDAAFQDFLEYLQAYARANPDNTGIAAYGWKNWEENYGFSATPNEE